MKKEYKKQGLVRLNKYIAMSGVASRRRADELILDGLVRVNGKTITERGSQIDPNHDTVVVKGKPLRPVRESVYVMFNKPPRVLATMGDADGRPSLGDYFAKARVKMFPVGKLDWDCEGLLLLTNDGTFAQRVSDPKQKIIKTYLVKLDGQPSDEQLQKMLKGISILRGRTQALLARRMKSQGSDKYDWIKIIISDSRNEQIRQMFAKLGFDVKKMQRIAVGSLKLSNLDKGKFKILDDEDLKKVFTPPKELGAVKKETRTNKARNG